MNIALGIFYMILCGVNLHTAHRFAETDHLVSGSIMFALALGMGFISGLYFGNVL